MHYSLIILAALKLAAAQNALADFGQTVPILGQMARTEQNFKDGLAIDFYSPLSRTLIVNKNTAPLPGNFVSDSSGEPFLALSTYSWIIKVNDTARDLIAKVELPYSPATLKALGVDAANTYVGILADDGKSWIIDEERRNVHSSGNKTCVMKLTSLDGEFTLLGRRTTDTANIFVQYGQGSANTVNIAGGKGVQQAEFVDGLRLSVEAAQPLKINVDLKTSVDAASVPAGLKALNSYTWVFNTSAPTQPLTRGSIRFPVNPFLLATQSQSINSTEPILLVAQRAFGAKAADAFVPVQPRAQKVSCRGECWVAVRELEVLDGEYVVLVGEGAAK